MKLERLNIRSIDKLLAGVRSGPLSPPFTNYFRQPMTGDVILGARTASTAVFINDDGDFFRLYFRSVDLADLSRLLRNIALPGPAVIGYVAKEPELPVQQAFRDAGFTDHAVFVRLTNYHFKTFEVGGPVVYAETADLDQLWESLHKQFDKYTDYFPSEATLLALIANKEVIVNKEAGAVVGYIIFRVRGHNVNFNYFYNKSRDPRDSLMLLHNFYAILHERRVRSGFQWNNVQNTRVRNLHRQFGWKEDGMKDLFFVKRHD
jgi:hypothetical protein